MWNIRENKWYDRSALGRKRSTKSLYNWFAISNDLVNGINLDTIDLQRNLVNLPKQLGFRALLSCDYCFILN